MVNNATSMGIEVARERRSRRADVSPGNKMCAIVEKKNAERPKPDRTRPVVVARADSGKLLAVVLTAATTPACAPKPVKRLHTINRTKCAEDMDTPESVPSSYIRFIPAYPTRENTKAPMSGIWGPLKSTIRPQIGPDTETPAGAKHKSDFEEEMEHTISSEPDDVDLSVRNVKTSA